MVKKLKREARRARAKPGAAWNGMVMIAESMDRSVVHFLPSFWEEAGRAFIEAGNVSYAGRAFAKARDAERVHALDVDAGRLREVYLEFALAGALTVRVISAYSRDLERSRRPAEALALFRDLCVRRTLGGVPPWKAMPRDLRRLITAANLDATTQETAFLREVLGSQAMKRAHSSVWQTYGNAIQQLAADDPKVAGVLLNLLPVPSDMVGSKFFGRWLEHLDDWDLLANLWRDGVAAAAGPRGGAAAWIERFLASRTEVPDRLFEVLRRAASRLARSRPLQLAVKVYSTYRIDVDLLDLALELGVPLQDPPARTECDLRAWAKAEGLNRRRDPVHVAADSRFRPLLAAAVPEAVGNAVFDRAAAGKPALTELCRQWLLELVADLDQGGVPRLTRGLTILSAQTSRATFEELPEAFPPLAGVDLAAVLGRTLRGGLFDELGWDALDKAAAELASGGDGKTGETSLAPTGEAGLVPTGEAGLAPTLQWSGNAPYLVVSDGVRALVLGPGGRLLEHELRLPVGALLDSLDYLDGELLVRYWDSNRDSRSYRSGDPDQHRDNACSYRFGEVTGAVVRVTPEAAGNAAGGWFRGAGVIHAGSPCPECWRDFFHDGKHFWRVEWTGAKRHREWREIDPASGRIGRHSLPSFFEDYLAAGWELKPDACHLLHLGPGTGGSPLGSRDGLVGWRLPARRVPHRALARRRLLPERRDLDRGQPPAA